MHGSRRVVSTPLAENVTSSTMGRALLAVVTVVGAALLLAAAGTPRGIKEGGTFRVGIVGLSSIDPVLGGALAIDGATCASLMTFPDEPLPEGLRVVPEIARGYPKVTNAGKTYTFTIRKGFRFSTGAPVTARSFAHTINRQLNPEMKSLYELDFESILGAQKVIAGKAQEAFGIVARGDTLRIRLRKPVGDLMKRLAFLCVVPEATPIDPEGVKAPVPGAGPYYIAEYVVGERVVLKRNPFYGGNRPRHVSRFVVDLSGDAATVLDRVDRGDLDYGWVPNNVYGERAPEFRRRYGVNKSRFFSVPANNLRMFLLNTSRPLFRNNVKLRQAVNFAVDRKALLRERGPLAGTVTDQFLPPGIPGFKDERIYPLEAPDVATARRLAKGRTRSGKAVLYVPATPVGSAQGQILKDNLKKIGIEVDIVQLPAPVLFQKLQTPGEPFDIGWIGWLGISDNFFLNFLFDGRTIGEPGFGNYSYFNSRKYNRLLDAASRLPVGSERYRSYGELDVDIAKNAAPAIAFAYDNTLTLVGPRTGCVIVNPELDLTAVCLK
jgi:ABC-type transport system substrate-binding protein